MAAPCRVECIGNKATTELGAELRSLHKPLEQSGDMVGLVNVAVDFIGLEGLRDARWICNGIDCAVRAQALKIRTRGVSVGRKVESSLDLIINDTHSEVK